MSDAETQEQDLPKTEEAVVVDEAVEPEESVSEVSADEVPETDRQLGRILEAILFASPKPCTAKELAGILKSAAAANPEGLQVAPYGKLKEAHIREALTQLAEECQDRTYEVTESAGGWQLVTKAEFSPWLRQLFPENRSARMSAPAMETLAIIAYRQPITRADLEAVRGVAVDGVMQTLLDRGLIKIAGRAEIPGRPLLYETTQFFMEHFGLKDLDELPNAGELRKIALPTAVPPPAELPASEPTPAGTTTAGQPASEAALAEEAPVVEANKPVETSGEPATEEPTDGQSKADEVSGEVQEETPENTPEDTDGEEKIS